ncbi:MAG: hypothetical protein JWR30_3403 [Conexibacter sp.]|jgi:hypothetical protein|nr:hypothetical protein [Conexibacter sp.]MDX6730551.1 hypothetical protein [Baekduia sp.]
MSRLATPVSVLALLGTTAALAACGGSSSASSAGGTGTTAAGAQGATMAKFQQCLKDQGVQLPQRPPGGGNGGGPPVGADGQPRTGTNGTPPAGGGFRGDPKAQKAMQACAKYRPQGAFRGGNGAGGGPQQSIAAFTPYLTCLKSAGLDVKVTDGFNALRNLKRDDPKVQAALKACQSKIPQRPQGAPSQTTPSSTTAQQS